MRTLTKLIVCLGAFTYVLPCFGQCSQLQTVMSGCGSGNCSQAVPINIPVASQYGETLSYFYVSCCNASIKSYTLSGFCNPGPEIRQKLAQVSSTQPIMVANCSGQYYPFVDQTTGSDFKINMSDSGLLKALK